MAQVLGSLTEQMRQNADPRQALEQFQEAGTIESSAQEDLNGQQTTHYKITVDVQKLAEEPAGPDVEERHAGGDQVRPGGLPGRAVDRRGGPPGPDGDRDADRGPDDGKTVPVQVQVDYSKWGEPVDIQAPPADQVGEFPS